MATDPTLLAIRFGYGLPVGAADPLDALAGPDLALRDWPGVTLTELMPVAEAYRVARKAKDEAAYRKQLQAADALALRGAKAIFARAIAGDGLRERLVMFWADHFTTTARNRLERVLPAILIDEAIRPHVAGRFADMLVAVTTHPGMLIYLNQEASIGPGSRKGQRRDKGLNENLARELLELHTLGVAAAYSQRDVRELAELLTGLTIAPGEGFTFDPARAEPGAETVLGITYRGDGMEPILRLLEDLAVRPETARHIARKLAVHFVADEPEAGLVAALEARWLETGGDLLAVTGVLMGHPASQLPETGKARQPFDYLVAALRALGAGAEQVLALSPREFRRVFVLPLEEMGQPFQRAPGPDGWPEAEAAWITPQGLAARIAWAVEVPGRLVKPLPDPRGFVATALGARAGERLVWAVSAAESLREGVALVLSSPEFNRR